MDDLSNDDFTSIKTAFDMRWERISSIGISKYSVWETAAIIALASFGRESQEVSSIP